MASDLIELNDVSFKEDKLNLLYLAVEIDNPYENNKCFTTRRHVHDVLSDLKTNFAIILEGDYCRPGGYY
jgi:hypothetical protein